VLLDVPTIEDCTAILQLRFEGLPLNPDCNIGELGVMCFEHGMTCADLEGMCRAVCLRALRRVNDINKDLSKDSPLIDVDDFREYINEAGDQY
jgi:hypothetical protein